MAKNQEIDEAKLKAALSAIKEQKRPDIIQARSKVLSAMAKFIGMERSATHRKLKALGL
jgi:transcriptional regulator of acetoin/glycerol metabolism